MSDITACRTCPLRREKVFSPNTDAEIDFIERFKTREMFLKAGDDLLREGAPPGKILFTLLAGWAFRYRTLRDGRRQILNFLLPGDFIGLQQQMAENTPHGVQSLTDIRVCVFHRDRLWDLYKNHPGLGYDLTWLSAHEELIVDENLLSVGRRSAAERITLLFISLYKRCSTVGMVSANGVYLPIKQQNIADALGLSLVHTNKTLRRLEATGIYELRDGFLKFSDLNSMVRLADYFNLPVRGRPLI